jgi:hypothetical protein
MGATNGILQKYGQFYIIGKIWQTVIKPIVSYAMFLTFGKSAIGDDKLRRLQLTAARCTLNEYNNDACLLERLKWPSMIEEACKQRVRLGYNYCHGFTKIPHEVFDIYAPPTSRTRRQLHNKQLKCLTLNNTEGYNRAGFKVIADTWNRLSQESVDLNRAQFKRATALSIV